MEVLHHALVEGNQAFAVGIAQGWSVHSVKPRIVNQIVVALQGRDQLAQGLHAGKLRTDQRHELRSDSVPTAAATGLQKTAQTDDEELLSEERGRSYSNVA